MKTNLFILALSNWITAKVIYDVFGFTPFHLSSSMRGETDQIDTHYDLNDDQTVMVNVRWIRIALILRRTKPKSK
jgi:hypothetical protein